MKPTLNECRALVRRVCRSCWGHLLRGWRSWAAGQQTRNSREWTRTNTAAADSTLAAVGSIPVQGNKLAEDSSRLVAAHSRAAAPQTRKLCPVPNPSRRRANPSHHPTRRASLLRPSHRHRASHRRRRATEPGRWRGTEPWPKRKPLIGRVKAILRRSWCTLPASRAGPMPKIWLNLDLLGEHFHGPDYVGASLFAVHDVHCDEQFGGRSPMSER
jgi:hypothetical protein